MLSHVIFKQYRMKSAFHVSLNIFLLFTESVLLSKKSSSHPFSETLRKYSEGTNLPQGNRVKATWAASFPWLIINDSDALG